jgi:hypothetical protein
MGRNSGAHRAFYGKATIGSPSQPQSKQDYSAFPIELNFAEAQTDLPNLPPNDRLDLPLKRGEVRSESAGAIFRMAGVRGHQWETALYGLGKASEDDLLQNVLRLGSSPA